MQSFNDCITINDQNELIAIRQGLDTLQWRIGDIANRNYEANRDRCSFSYVCAAVGYYSGRSGSRVQQLARAAAFYPKEWREKYENQLSMEHYIQAMPYENWQFMLEQAAFGGRLKEPKSVDQMVAESFAPIDPITPDNFGELPTAVISYDTAVPTVQVLGKPDTTIQTILGLIGRLADALGLDEAHRSKLSRAMQLLQEALTVSERA